LYSRVVLERRAVRIGGEVVGLVVAELRVVEVRPERVGLEAEAVVRATFHIADEAIPLLVIEDRAEGDAAGRGDERRGSGGRRDSIGRVWIADGPVDVLVVAVQRVGTGLQVRVHGTEHESE